MSREVCVQFYRTIPLLRRRRASTASSVSRRLLHFTKGARDVTPYRGFGLGASMALSITRAQSSGVVFDFARVSLTPEKKRAYSGAYGPPFSRYGWESSVAAFCMPVMM